MSEYIYKHMESGCDVFDKPIDLPTLVKCEEIVRCRDCKYADWDITANWCVRNEHCEFTIDADLNGFCSWGVRRSD